MNKMLTMSALGALGLLAACAATPGPGPQSAAVGGGEGGGGGVIEGRSNAPKIAAGDTGLNARDSGPQQRGEQF